MEHQDDTCVLSNFRQTTFQGPEKFLVRLAFKWPQIDSTCDILAYFRVLVIVALYCAALETHRRCAVLLFREQYHRTKNLNDIRNKGMITSPWALYN